MVCPKCGCEDVSVQTYQETTAVKTKEKTKSKYKEKRHGLFWWLFIGWWWWFIDLFLWIFLFLPRVLLHIGRKRDYIGKATTTSTTKNKVSYRTVCVCQNCAHRWDA